MFGDMFDKNLTDAEQATQVPQYVDGSDPDEGIDEAALMYVIGYDDGGDADQAMPAVANDIQMESKPDGETSHPQPTQDQTSGSWRDALHGGDSNQFKRERARERNIRAMSSLWNRVFPIDYDAIPIASYSVVDETGNVVPEIPFPEPSGASAGPDDLTLADEAIVAGLGLLGVTDDIQDEIATPKAIFQSDTSNRDTVMIGNDALSDALAGIGTKGGGKHYAHPKDDDGETQDEGTDGFIDDNWQGQDALPNELNALYDEAMSMFSSMDDLEATSQGNESNDGTDDQYDFDSEDVSFPVDGDTVPSEKVSEDYRRASEPDDIYESDEWKQLEQEIQESQEVVKTGLGQLDILAGISVPQDDATTEEADTQPTELEDLAADGGDEEGVEAVTSEIEFEDVADPAGSDDTVTTDNGADAIDLAIAADDIDEPFEDDSLEVMPADGGIKDQVEEEPTEAEAVEAQPQRGRSILAKIRGLFIRTEKDAVQEPASSDDEEQSAVAEQGSYAEPEAEAQQPGPATVAMDSTDLEPTWHENQDATEPLDYHVIDEHGDQDAAVSIRYGDDDEVIAMKDDEPTSEDYRMEAGAGMPTMPMPIDGQSDADDYRKPTKEPYQEPDDAPTVDIGTVQQEPVASQHQQTQRPMPSRLRGRERIRRLEMSVPQEMLLPLPTSRNGQIDAKIKVGTSEFLNPKRKPGARSSQVKLSVRPSRVNMGSIAILPEGSGYIPERSPMGSRLREQGRYEYEPIRRIGEPLRK